ncbi:MAG: hypothetical protein IKT56_01225 [Clostridia bacterium]|nr:hypothetical protein [Clostridia bacterium]
MDNVIEKTLKKLSAITALSALAASLILQLADKYLAPYADKAVKVSATLGHYRKLCLILFAICAVIFIFIFFKERYGAAKAVFFTILLASFVSFALGGVMVAAGIILAENSAGFTLVSYVYMLAAGFLILVYSAVAFIVTAFIYAIWRIILRISKKSKNADTLD